MALAANATPRALCQAADRLGAAWRAGTLIEMSRSRPQPRGRAAVLVAVACCASLTACGGSKGSASTASTAGATASTASGATRANTSPAEAVPSHIVSAHVVSATAGTLTATMHAAGHDPRVNAPWPIAFAVTSGGKPARAEVAYEYLFGGQVVAHRSHYRFTGSFHDVFQWPASAVGYPLTFRAVIVSEGVTFNLDYPVQVRN